MAIDRRTYGLRPTSALLVLAASAILTASATTAADVFRIGTNLRASDTGEEYGQMAAADFEATDAAKGATHAMVPEAGSRSSRHHVNRGNMLPRATMPLSGLRRSGDHEGVLAHGNSKKKKSLPTYFLNCEKTPESQRPKVEIELLGDRYAPPNNRVRYSSLGPVLTMRYSGTAFVRDRLRTGLRSSIHQGRISENLKVFWYYNPAAGSFVEPIISEGKVFEAEVDTIGNYLLAARVERASGVCTVKSVNFVATANVPYGATGRLHRENLSREFDLKELTSYLDRVKGREAWEYSRGAGVIIAILDSGLNYNHPLVARNVWTNEGEISGNGLDDDGNGYVDDHVGFDFFNDDPWPFDDDGHGSRVAGLAASGIGIAPEAQVLPVKVSSFGSFNVEDLISAILYAVDAGAHIINVSLVALKQSDFQRIGQAIEYARENGVLIVAAVGNHGEYNKMVYPASHPSTNVITVAASLADGSLADFSNYGVEVADIAAPGGHKEDGRLKSLYMYNSEHLFSWGWGTSLATPLVSGVAAQILSINPQLTPEEVIDIIMGTVDYRPSLDEKVWSSGTLNALNAVKAAQRTLVR